MRSSSSIPVLEIRRRIPSRPSLAVRVDYGIPRQALGASPSQAELEGQLSDAYRQLHAIAASLGQLKTQWTSSGDDRFKQGARELLPYFQAAIAKYQAIGRQLGRLEIPSDIMLTLSDFSDWSTDKVIKPVVEGAAGAVKSVGESLGGLLGLALAVVGVGLVVYLVAQFKGPARAG